MWNEIAAASSTGAGLARFSRWQLVDLDHHTQDEPAKALGRLNERPPTIRSIKT
ncbi:msr3620 [Mesorhizobium japonicum MAFF 303099]|uniref:Msr3620 protein n=1 Tax=Mesorhizobium japonicum (strain LMG 29417 / CECT 9101 / MAFF 303099) TaxID=266835 RepID=Q98FU0_RHILO|nr:msr3620 [Mesorhizobium japonicum MAFF 303099]